MAADYYNQQQHNVVAEVMEKPEIFTLLKEVSRWHVLTKLAVNLSHYLMDKTMKISLKLCNLQLS